MSQPAELSSATTPKGLLAGLLRASAGVSSTTRNRFARVIAAVLYCLAAPRRRVALRNLELCFPESTAAQRRVWAQTHFYHYVRSMLDRGVLWFGQPEQVRDMVQLQGEHHLQQALSVGAVILVSPHFCGLDAGWTRLTQDYFLATMYQPQRNQNTDSMMLLGRQRFVPEGAQQSHPLVLGKQDGVRHVMRALMGNIPLYYLPDMDFGARDAEFVPFFGVRAATITSVARLAARTEAQVLMCATLWNESQKKYVTTIERPDGLLIGGYWDQTLRATAVLNAKIERIILQDPAHLAQYLWTHKRFKTRPNGEASVYE